MLVFILSFFILESFAEPSSCADNVKELAKLHLLLNENPTRAFSLRGRRFAKAAGASLVAGGVAAAVAGDVIRNVPNVEPVDPSSDREQGNRVRSHLRSIRTILQAARPTGDVRMTTDSELDQRLRGELDGLQNRDITQRIRQPIVTEADAIVNRIERDFMSEVTDSDRTTPNRQFSQGERLRLRAEVEDYYRALSDLKDQRDLAQKAAISQARSRVAVKQIRNQMAGGLFGALAGGTATLGLNLATFKKACGDYQIYRLMHHFNIDYHALFKDKPTCTLSPSGAALFAEGNNAQDICRDFPKIEEALENSLQAMYAGVAKKMTDKKGLFSKARFNCEERKMTLPIEDSEIELTFNDDHTEFFFNLKGSARGPNRDRVTYEPGSLLPEFLNQGGLALRPQYGSPSSEDFGGLVGQFLVKAHSPTEGIAKRRYFVGAALTASQLYREPFAKECPKTLQGESEMEVVD